MNPLISVIVPVYNVEDYLDRCVESIVNQTYKNLEIILVDDGSTDCSGKKCDEWKVKDSRIVVIHKENGGQAEARNKGLELATGDYIGFVDSDDLISNSMYEEMLKVAVKHNSDVVGCRHVLFDDVKHPCFEDGSFNGQVIEFTQKEAVLDIIREEHFESTVWNLLVISKIAKSVKFDVGKIHEDVLWPFRVFLSSQKFAYVEKCFYAYFQRSGSTMNIGYSEKRFDALDALETRSLIIKQIYPDLYPIATRVYLGACRYHYQSLCRQPKSNDIIKYKKILYKRFCCGDNKALFDEIDFKNKIWNKMFRVNPQLTCKIRNILGIGI